MEGAGAVFLQGGQVFGSAVAFVSSEAVLGPMRVGFDQLSVARHFGDDGGGGDRDAHTVAADQKARSGAGEVGDGQAVYQDERWGQRERAQGTAHGFMGGAQDTEAIYLVGLDLAETERKRFGGDARVGPFALALGEFFGVGDAVQPEVGGQDDAGDDDRAGEGAAPNFVQPGNQCVPLGARGPFMPPEVFVDSAAQWIGCIRVSGQKMKTA